MKAYVKPELRFESFVLSQTVATCGLKLGSNDSNTCKIVENHSILPGNVVGGFANTGVCDHEFSEYCYGGSGGEGLPTTWKS